MQRKSDGLSGHLKVEKNKPVLDKRLRFFYNAYVRLSSDRTSGMGLEAIPWSSMCRYAKHYNLSRNTSEFLFDALNRMDKDYIEKKNAYDERTRKLK